MLTTVLVVDDDPEIRKLLTSILEEASYIVETADSGKEAIKVSKKFPVDVALIDVELPDTKGTDLLGALKEIRPKMVKIIVTGHPSVENAVKAVNEKADGYILKPFNPSELLEKIKNLLAEKKDAYFSIIKEVDAAKQSTPVFKYQSPYRW